MAENESARIVSQVLTAAGVVSGTLVRVHLLEDGPEKEQYQRELKGFAATMRVPEDRLMLITKVHVSGAVGGQSVLILDRAHVLGLFFSPDSEL